MGEKYAGLISLINADFRHKLSLARAILIGLDACMIRARTLNTWIKKPSGLRSAQRSHSPSCSWTVMVELIHRSRSTNIITLDPRLVSEIFLSHRQRSFSQIDYQGIGG
jgi:hypothetical protein